MSRLVLVERYYDIPAAICAKSALDAYGIPAFLHNRELVNVNWFWIPAVHGIKLYTFEGSLAEARALLDVRQKAVLVESPVEAFWRRKYLNGILVFLFLFTGLQQFFPFWVRRRRWKSKSYSTPKTGLLSTLFMFFLLYLLLPLVGALGVLY